MGVKIREAKPAIEPAAEPTPVTEPAAEPATQPVIEPATEPAIEPATEPATEPAIEPATEPVIEPAIEPVIEPAAESATSINEAWAVYKKRKRDNWTATAEEKNKEEKYEQFLTDFLDQNGRLPDLRDEDPYMKEFEGFLPGVRRLQKRTCN